MVRRYGVALIAVAALAGCTSQVDNPAPRSLEKSKEDQIAAIKARTDMPEEMKQRVIQSLQTPKNK